jgi:hypothetical protein
MVSGVPYEGPGLLAAPALWFVALLVQGKTTTLFPKYTHLASTVSVLLGQGTREVKVALG